jgi:hypothetical protein
MARRTLEKAEAVVDAAEAEQNGRQAARRHGPRSRVNGVFKAYGKPVATFPENALSKAETNRAGRQ